MQAIRLKAAQDIEVLDLPIPEPTENQVVVKVEASTICNMHELKTFKGTYRLASYPGPPGYPGHEGAGSVVNVGKNVIGFNEGDRVAMAGFGGPGLHAEYVTRDPNRIVKLRSDLSFEEAAPLELVGCVLNAFDIARPLWGRSVAISGLGAPGLIAIQLAQANGATEIIAMDVLEERVKRAEKLGADRGVNATDEAAVSDLMGKGVQTLIECSGNVQALERAFQIAREEVVVFGYSDAVFTIDQAYWFNQALIIRNAAFMGKEPMRVFRGL